MRESNKNHAKKLQSKLSINKKH